MIANIMNKKILIIIAAIVIIGGTFLFFYPLKKQISPTAYSSLEYGLSFSRPQNYAVFENTFTGERLHHSVVLFEDTPENRDIFFGPNSNRGTEGPPTITITMFQNNLDNYTLQSFVEGTNFSNFKLSDGKKMEMTVAGKPAWRYRATGLYENDNVVVVRPEYVYMFTVFFNSPDNQILKDFDDILKTVGFPDIVPSSGAQGSFRDGKHLGYIHDINVPDLTILFDDAVWLTGTAAQNAAIEAGRCTEANRSECTPNDYFIKNEKVRDESVLIDSNALLFMQTWKMEETGEVTEREIGLVDFAKLVNDPTLHWRTLPYNITIQNGKIIRIEEMYIP